MKKLLLTLTLLMCGFIGSVVAQAPTPTPLTADTIQKIRILEAEKKAAVASRDRAIALRDEWKRSANEWKDLYQKEKARADITLIDAIKTRDLQITNLRQQIADDIGRINALERRVKSLKRQRWIFGAAGFAAGTVTGVKVNF